MHIKIDAKVGVDSSGQIDYLELYNTKTTNTYCYNISIDKNVNEAGSCSFTMLRECPGYNNMYVLGTAIKVSVENPQGTAWLPVFLGRITSISTDFVFNQTVQCEGALAWFGDIIVRPHLWYVGMAVTIEDATKPEGSYTTTKYVQRNVLPSEMFSYIDACYAARRSSERKIGVGSISSNLIFYSDGTVQNPHYFFEGVTDYNSALEWIKKFADLDSSSMYYAVPANNGWEAAIQFISSQDTYGLTNLREIKYAENLIDLQMDMDGSGFYTSVIGLGKDKIRINDVYYPNPYDPTETETGGQYDHVDNTGTTMYGVIERVENFENKAGIALANAATEYVSFGCGVDAQGFEVRAIDPLFQNGLMLDLGDHVKLTDVVHMGQVHPSLECIITSCHIELDRPGECSYTFFPCGTAYRKTTAKPLSSILAENTNTTKTQADYMAYQQAVSYNVLGDNTVTADFTDGTQMMYQLVKDDDSGEYYYKKYVCGMQVNG